MNEERKHLFGSTEKSDFIVNMTEGQYQKMGLIYLSLVAAVMFVMSIPYYLAKGGLTIFNNGLLKYVDTSVANATCSSYISYLQIALFALGFVGFLILIISATKEYFKGSENKAFLLVVLFMLFVATSTVMAYELKAAFLGRDYRYHGMLTFFSYVGLFAAASQINSRDRRKTFLDIFMVIATVNAVYGLLQIVPALVEDVPNFFYDMFIATGDSSISYERFAADGLVHTPHALAALMTMAVGIGGAGFIFERSQTRRFIYLICTLIFTAAAIATATAPGIIGVAVVLFVLLITAVAKGIKGKKTALTYAVILIVLCAIVYAIMFALDRATLYDGNIIFVDATARIGASYPDTVNGGFSDRGISVYPKMWNEGIVILKDCWVFGSGPDCIGTDYYGTSELYNASRIFTIDRSFNEYLDLALACGIPCLMAYLSIGFVTIKKGIKMVGSFFKNEDSWTCVGLLAAVIGYAAQANFNISIITVTPIFFIFAGLLWNRPHTESEAKGKKRKKIKD